MIAFLVAGTASGVGKTTVSLALMAAFRERGLVVQPFKCGPDFLDTGHHSAVCGRASRNLDSWMLTAEANRALFERACRGADVAIVEGMMGLFDGRAGSTDEGSAAEIAKLLGIPVVLVLDASKSARSIAAVVKGFENFDNRLRFAGIVLNGVSSEHHHRILRDAIRTVTRTPVLGRIPEDPSLAVPERHLGLRTIEEETSPKKRRKALAETARRFLDMNLLSALTRREARTEQHSPSSPQPDMPLRIGVARDKAFSFYYEDNFDLLHAHGAEIVVFSPLSDRGLPPDLNGLYLGGGYPELYSKSLSRNRTMCDAVCSFAESGKPVYAECGGMVYLGQSLTTSDGETVPMAGLLPLEFEMTPELVRFGYVEVTFTKDCLLGLKGETARGHSFHHSRLRPGASMPTSYRLRYSLSGQREPEGFTHKNVLASYIHLHFGANPVLVPSLLDRARRCQVADVVA